MGLQRCGVRIWWADLGTARDLAYGTLSELERARCARFRRVDDRDRSAVAAALVRAAVASELGVPTADVTLDRGCRWCGAPHGPVRVLTDPSLSLSVSHSAQLVVVALAVGVDIGIDVEVVPEHGGPPAEAAVALTPRELATLGALDPARAAKRFTQYWVAKEALLKATRDGLTLPPARIGLECTDDSVRLVSWADRPEEVGQVQLSFVPTPVGHGTYVASLCVRSGGAYEALAGDGFLLLCTHGMQPLRG